MILSVPRTCLIVYNVVIPSFGLSILHAFWTVHNKSPNLLSHKVRTHDHAISCYILYIGFNIIWWGCLRSVWLIKWTHHLFNWLVWSLSPGTSWWNLSSRAPWDIALTLRSCPALATEFGNVGLGAAKMSAIDVGHLMLWYFMILWHGLKQSNHDIMVFILRKHTKRPNASATFESDTFSHRGVVFQHISNMAANSEVTPKNGQTSKDVQYHNF